MARASPPLMSAEDISHASAVENHAATFSNIRQLNRARTFPLDLFRRTHPVFLVHGGCNGRSSGYH